MRGLGARLWSSYVRRPEPISDDALEEEWHGSPVDRDDLRRERGWSDWDGGAPMRMRLLPFAVLLFGALPPPSAAQSPVGLPGRFTGLHGLTAGGNRIRTTGPAPAER